MKIVAASNGSIEIEEMVKAGASEIFLGYNPPIWNRRYTNLISLNRRYFKKSQIDAFSDVKRSIQIAHTLGTKVNFTLNAHSYSKEQFKIVERTVNKATSAGADHFIAADMSAIRLLRKKGLSFHISTGGNAINAEAARFYESLGARRIILPRQMRLDEISAIRKAVKIELEVFMLYDTCKYMDGYCQYLHGTEELLGTEHGCTYLNEFRHTNGDAIADRRIKHIEFPMFCASDHISSFKKMGIDFVKISGRRFPTELKLRGISYIRRTIEHPDDWLEMFEDTFQRRWPKYNSSYYGD